MGSQTDRDRKRRERAREREVSQDECNVPFLCLADTLKSRVQSSYAYASNLSEQGDTINTRNLMLGL